MANCDKMGETEKSANMGTSSRSSLEQYFKEAKNSTSHRQSHDPTAVTDDVHKERSKTECKHEITVEAKNNAISGEKTSKVKARNRRKKTANATEKQGIKEKAAKKPAETQRADRNLKQSSITAHFQVRRSGRRCKSALKNEEQEKIMQKLLDEDESGLEIKMMEDKGRGVFATRNFRNGELICEYAGELIDYDLGIEREKEYAGNPEYGCYSYFFQYKNKKYCVDATKESHRLGRLLNHSKTNRNISTKVFPVKDIPRLILVASRDIKSGEELLYDYGERNKVAIESHPWLRS